MLMHTKGILVMTPDSAMVLTGKQSLDFSGGVSAEDNFGIGGYDRVMGPNGQAQYWAPNLPAARDVLMAHYDHTYVAPGETGPRRAVTTDPVDRDVSDFPHACAGSDFTTVGEIFSVEPNPDRKKPFDIRTVMRALSDQDHPVLERWAGMADADTAVVQDVHLGGIPVCLLGIESRSVPRRGFPPTDGPDTYTAGTLFPRSSKKAARAINAASGNRPLVVLANLSGFDGSPESMRKLQLEYGAEIGRAIVNFDGPDRLLRDLALPRRRVRGVLQGAEPEHDGAGAGGLVRLGARRRPGRGRGVLRRRQRPHGDRPAGARTWRPASPRPAGAERAALTARARRACGRRCARRSWARWPPSSTGCTASSAPSRSARWTPIISAAELRPRIIEAIEARLGRAAGTPAPRQHHRSSTGGADRMGVRCSAV